MTLRAAGVAAGLISIFAACASGSRPHPSKPPSPAGAAFGSLPPSGAGLDPRFFDPIIAEEGPLPRANPDPCYGYLWWLVRPGCGEGGPNGDAFGPIEGFRATGWGGNYVVAVPSAGIVAVRTKAPMPGETLVEEQETSFAEFPERVMALQR